MRRPPLAQRLVGAALAAVSACAPHTFLAKPEVGLPAAYESPARGIDPALGSEALDRWWTLFGDAQLSALIDQALAAAPDAKSALGRLREARANRDQALYPFWLHGNPTASATEETTKTKSSFGSFAGAGGGGVGTGTTGAGATGIGTTGTGTTGTGTGTTGTTGGSTTGGFFSPSGELQQYAGGFQASWELDLFGDVRVARRAANADLSAARFDYEATRLSLAAQVANDLFQARGVAVQLADARENARIAESLAESGRRKVAAGLAATSETARLESDAESARAEVVRFDSILRGDRRHLLALVGRGAAPLDSLPVEARVYPAPRVPPATPGELLARRPDVREAEAQLAGATARVQLDKLALFPNITLQPGIQLSRTAGAYRSFSRIWSIGLGAEVPVLDRPKLIAEIRAQNARGEQAVAAYEKAVQNAYADAESAITGLAADQERSERLALAEGRARFAFDAASIGYRAGLTDITPLLQAEQTWRATRATLTAAQTAALQDSVAAFKALGGGWTPPEAVAKRPAISRGEAAGRTG